MGSKNHLEEMDGGVDVDVNQVLRTNCSDILIMNHWLYVAINTKYTGIKLKEFSERSLEHRNCSFVPSSLCVS